MNAQLSSYILIFAMISTVVILIVRILLWNKSKKQLSKLNIEGTKKKVILENRFKWNLVLVGFGAIVLLGTAIGLFLSKL